MKLVRCDWRLYDIMDMHIDSITISSMNIQDTYCHILLLEITCPLTKINVETMEINKGLCHIMALPFTLKRILRLKKSYENSNISPCQNIILKKSSKRNQNPSRYYNSLTNLKFQHKPKCHLSKILIER